jgi:hypothetical protein
MDAEKDGGMFREKRTDGVLQYAQLLLLSTNGSSPQSDPNVVQRHLLRREEGVFEPAAVDRIGKTLGGE